MLELNTEYEAILWDFDGVLMNSNPIRDRGFAETLAAYPAAEVESLLAYHRANGGLSRYVKFRYFFETIRNEPITEEEVKAWALRFSGVVKTLLFDPALLILETLDWVKDNHTRVPMHIVSGSDQEELREVCRHHHIDQFFKDIQGSPTPKKQLVAGLLSKYGYTPDRCVLVGDSVNDYDAARVNGLQFFPYNNPDLLSCNTCV